MKNFKKLLLVSALFLISGAFILVILASNLTKNQRIEANVLVVEGWIPDYGLYKALKEFENNDYDYILITGECFANQVNMFINSFLIFSLHEHLKEKENSEIQTFDLHIESSLGTEDSAHFVFWVNDQKLNDFYTNEYGGIYHLEWEGRMADIDSVMIQFDNDMVSELGDRNLIIKKITLNDHNLIVEHADLFIDRGRPFGRYRWNVTANSYAELAAHYFVDKGIDKRKIIPISNNHLHIRRTYGNALALKGWMLENDINIEGINIVTMDYHSQRTWLTYNKMLGKEDEVGIISAHNLSLTHHQSKRYRAILKESIALAYYYIFILPWI